MRQKNKKKIETTHPEQLCRVCGRPGKRLPNGMVRRVETCFTKRVITGRLFGVSMLSTSLKLLVQILLENLNQILKEGRLEGQ